MYIVFEGPDGSGKSTMLEMFAKDLRSRNYEVKTLHQPGSTILGEKLRVLCKDKDLKASGDSQMYMMAADHAQFISEHLHGRSSSQLLLQDRHSAVSSYAYQVIGNGVSYPLFRHLYDREGMWPDLILLFQPSLKTIITRIKARGQAEDRYEASSFLKRVVQGYKEVKECGVIPANRYLTINGNLDKIAMYRKVVKAVASHSILDGTAISDAAKYIAKHLK